MRDQAEQLREIVVGLQQEGGIKKEGQTRVIAITSGKGGVGKTSFTTNLGIYLGQMGYRIIIIDGDFGLANVDLMLGITPKQGLKEMILGQMDAEEVMTLGPQGVRVISGGSGIKDLVNLPKYRLDDFLEKIDKLNNIADIILIDTGAGATDNIVNMVLAAQEIILIATPEPTSITDAYALTKIITTARRDINLHLVINRVESMKEAGNIFRNFNEVVRRFLGITIKNLGFIYEDPYVSKSIKEQVPMVIEYPKCRAVKQIAGIADELIKQDATDARDNQGMVSYVKRFIEILGFKNKGERISAKIDGVR